MSRIEFCTTNFEAAHGHKPRGVGRWFFDFHRPTGEWCTEEAPATMPFSEAKRWAMKFARENRCDWVSVGS